jgi:glyoxylase-like metal-dependent hydrolase (beta-lactamase superfamily II)
MQREIVTRVVRAAALVGAAILVAPTHADSVNNATRSVVELAPGVYSIRHEDAPDAFPQGNTTVVIGQRDVLVVDSCYLPSSARKDIDQVRTWTSKPVRYLVNTHWHYDHTMGNGAYWSAFPGLDIVAHAETARRSRDYNPGWFARFPRRADLFRKALAEGKDPDGKVLTEEEKREYADALRGLEPVQAEFSTLEDRTPNLTFHESLTLDLGGREVQVRFLGRGNTAGDAVVYLPREKILVAGDLVVHPVPYMFSGFPSEYVRTLQALDRLDYDILVPGHGEVLRGARARDYVDALGRFTVAVIAAVEQQVNVIGNGQRNLVPVREAVQQSFDVAPWRDRFAGADAKNRDFFDTTYAGLITAAHAEIWGK